MTTRLISHLRHVGLAVPDLEAERDFYVRHWGLVPVAEDQDMVHLAATGSPESHVLRLRRAEKRID
ncbi:oxidoreductase, partial [Streptomyces sp. NPDC006356]